jgi:uncharacterized protein YcbK (DUF882 family)
MKLTKNFSLSEFECNCGNFSLSEFECNCGCEMPDEVLVNIKELAIQLQYIREYLNEPIKLTNAYRCQKHNDSIKGSSNNSQHILGKAADIKIKTILPSIVYDLIEDFVKKGYIKQGGVGKYKTFTHYDIRGYKARWNYEK